MDRGVLVAVLVHERGVALPSLEVDYLRGRGVRQFQLDDQHLVDTPLPEGFRVDRTRPRPGGLKRYVAHAPFVLDIAPAKSCGAVTTAARTGLPVAAHAAVPPRLGCVFCSFAQGLQPKHADQ